MKTKAATQKCVFLHKSGCMSQALDKQINDYLPLLGNEEKQSILSVIKSFLSLKREPEQNISLEQYNKEIEESLVEYKKGNHVSQDDLEKKVKKW